MCLGETASIGSQTAARAGFSNGQDVEKHAFIDALMEKDGLLPELAVQFPNQRQHPWNPNGSYLPRFRCCQHDDIYPEPQKYVVSQSRCCRVGLGVTSFSRAAHEALPPGERLPIKASDLAVLGEARAPALHLPARLSLASLPATNHPQPARCYI